MVSSLDRSVDENQKQYGIVDDFHINKNELGSSSGHKSENIDQVELLFDY